MKIKNPNYRKFLDLGEIDLIEESHIKRALNNISGRHAKEGRALLIAMYYTGARPNEVLRLKAKDIDREANYIVISLPGSKGGLARKLYFQYKRPMIKELYNFAKGRVPLMFLFYNYWSNYTRHTVTKRFQDRHNKEITAKLRYYFAKWFAGVVPSSVPPYFLRHNRFSKMAMKGATDKEIQLAKGSKSIESVGFYTHMSSANAKKLARIQD